MRPGRDGIPHRRNGRDRASALRAGRRRRSMPRERKRRASAGSLQSSPGPNRTCSSPRDHRKAVEAQALDAFTRPGEPGGRLHDRAWRILQSVRPSFPCIRTGTDAEVPVTRAEGQGEPPHHPQVGCRRAGRLRKAEYGASTAQPATRTRDDGTRSSRVISLPPRRGVSVPQLVVSGPRSPRGRAPSPGPLRTRNRAFSLTPTSSDPGPAA